MENTTKKNDGAVKMADGIKTANDDKGKANQAFMCLCNGVIDPNQLVAFGEKNVRHALESIVAFKKVDEETKKQAQAQIDIISNLMISAGLVNPTIDLKTIRGVKQSSINCLYHALCSKANGATWAEIEELTKKENAIRGTNYKGLHKFIGNFAKQRAEHGYTVEYNAMGVKITDTKK